MAPSLELFPLPCCEVGAGPSRRLARRGQQKVKRRTAVWRQAAMTCAAWNWMAGHEAAPPASSLSVAQQCAQSRALECASLVPPPEESKEAALGALLRSDGGYDPTSGVGDLATFRQGSVSLPVDVSDSPALAELAPRSTLEKTESLECMLRPQSEVMALDDSLGVVTPYMDPVLGGDRQRYIDFLEDLDSRGLLSWSQQPKVLCSVFFVNKKPSAATGADLRMIIDCRPANRAFKEAPNTVLASPESLATLEVDESDTLFTSTVDVRDCFYRIRIPLEFAEYFALPPVDASDISSCKGRFPGRVFPCISVLPMGFSWSLWIAQEINRSKVVEAGLPASAEVNAHSQENTFVHHPLRFVVYVDNIAIFGRDKEMVNKAMEKVIVVLNSCGLLTHEHTEAEPECKLLGLQIDGTRKEICMTGKRYWRIKWAIEWVLRKKKVKGRILERIVGHYTFAALLNRNALSVTHTIHVQVYQKAL